LDLKTKVMSRAWISGAPIARNDAI